MLFYVNVTLAACISYSSHMLDTMDQNELEPITVRLLEEKKCGKSYLFSR